jgi:hypothetical protein
VNVKVMPFPLAEAAAVGLPPFSRLPARSLNPILHSRKHAHVTSLPDPRGVLGLTGAAGARHTRRSYSLETPAACSASRPAFPSRLGQCSPPLVGRQAEGRSLCKLDTPSGPRRRKEDRMAGFPIQARAAEGARAEPSTVESIVPNWKPEDNDLPRALS